MSEFLTVEHEGPITWFRLNRASKLNCLNRELLHAIIKACAQTAENKEARIVIITGGPAKVFCAGADLAERKGMSEGEVIDYLGLIQETMSAVENLPQPVIAAMNGSAFGGGTELALACDLRMIVEDGQMRLTEVKLGIIPGAGGTQRLPRLIGKSRAKELILTARSVSAREALEIGLVHRVVPTSEELESQARRWARDIAGAAPLALRAAKQAIDSGYDRDLAAGLAIETRSYIKLLNTKDRLEGLKAFAEKREPVYTGE